MNQKFQINPGQRWAILTAGVLTVAVLVPESSARPYATSLTNSGTSISFRLNESADSVKVISGGGTVTNDLGPLAKGLTVTNLTIAGVFKIQVTKAAGPGYIQGVANQVSEDSNNFVKFANQRGLAVNKNTNSPYFGRIYVAVGGAGTVASNQFTLGSRSVTDGIYLLNADQTDAVGQGNTGLNAGLNDGKGFDALAASGESPGRLFVGPDDSLYIADWSDANGGVSVTDANVATNALATNVLFGLGGPTASTNMHGSVSSVYVEGSLAGGNLVVFTQDEDLGSRNGVYRYDIGSGPLPYSQPETLAFTYGLGAQVAKITRGPDGKWYCSNRRADNASTTGVFVLSEDGSTQLWSSRDAWRELVGNPTAFDIPFGECRGFDVSADGKYLASIRGNTNSLSIVPMDGGIPNITNLVVVPTVPTTSIGRDLTFDAVGNIYTVSSGQGLLRIYSPGGFSVVTTGSDGTLEMLVPQVDVSVAAVDNFASEPSADTGEFMISRASADISQPLTVRFTTSGSATSASDYVLKTNSVALTTNAVVIPAGEANVVVSLTVTDDSVAELTETANLVISPSAAYTVVGQPATVAIQDDESPSIDITATQGTVFEGNTSDYARFQLTRRGDPNAGPITVELHNAGDTARYVSVASVNMDPGVITQTFDVNPVNDSLLQGNGVITLAVTNGTGYTVGLITPSASAAIVEDEVQPATVLFSDDFSGDPSTNWVIRFGSGNGVDDYRINEQILTLPSTPYDYSVEGIPPAPNGNDTLGLKVTVNKDEGTALGGAGINLYPIGKSFSGDYALRFDMYLLINTGAGTTEYTLFGMNHSGNETNWFRSTGNGFTNSAYDGLWVVLEADTAGLGTHNGNGAAGDYVLVSSPSVNIGGIWGPSNLANRDASAFVDAFKTPPWGVSGLAGAPANGQGSLTPSWAQVELSQIGNQVTLKINNTTIFTHTYTGAYKSGNIMLGYNDGHDSNTGIGAAVIYDNVRVVSLTQPSVTLTSAARTGTTTILDFTCNVDDPISAFTVRKATTVTGAYNPVAATIVKLSPGVYQATLTGQNDDAAFYRISR